MLTHEQQLLRDTAQASFWTAYDSVTDIMEGIHQRIESDSDQETYTALTYAPRPRQMEGSRTHRSVPSFSYNVVNKKWESTVDISYEMWKYGRLGNVQSMLQSMGDKARLYPSRLVADLMNAGDTDSGHDSQVFYSNAHVDVGARYSTAQNNDHTSAATTGTVPTVLEMHGALTTHRNAFDGFLDGDGDPVAPVAGERMIVLCSSTNIQAARAVFMSDQITGPISNDLKGIFEPRLNPFNDSSDEFFTFRAGGRRKPFIYQVAEAVSLKDNMGNDAQFETEDVSFGTFGFYNVAYGDWRYTNRHIFT
jgi:phage major head subunit gpT-like protein